MNSNNARLVTDDLSHSHCRVDNNILVQYKIYIKHNIYNLGNFFCSVFSCLVISSLFFVFTLFHFQACFTCVCVYPSFTIKYLPLKVTHCRTWCKYFVRFLFGRANH